MTRYPLKLTYHAKTALWGGKTLKDEWGKTCDYEKLAETWELSVRPDATNAIENGEAAGMTLGEYLGETKNAVGSLCEGDRFPLLIKFIDASDKLSLQVHPSNEYAAAHENDPGKTEMWYIVSADDNAEIIYGLADFMDASDFAACVRTGEIPKAVNRVKVHAGECYFIPAGLVHAIGSGCLIAEIQQNSDLTYRVYDYDRRDGDGNLRELHTEKALDVVTPFSEGEISSIRFSRFPKLKKDTCLAACKYFEVHLLSLGGYKNTLCADEESFHSVLCLEGEGFILAGGVSYPLKRGDSYYLPAGMGEYTLCGNAKVLLTRM